MKNILKKILNKKKTKKVVKKKTKVLKKVTKTKKISKLVKVKKATKQINKKKTFKDTKKKDKTEVISDPLRIPKNNEQKPEIKKVKKQETEKKIFKTKDYVVYPKHVETYILKFEKDKANGMVPVNKQSHLRPLATINQINKCVSILKSKPKIKRSMWSRRAQEYELKISSGKIYDLAEVVRDLNKGDDIMIDQSYSERQLFEKAYERLLTEFQIVMGSNLEDAQKKLDKALKRNLEKQTQKVEEKSSEEEIINQEIEE